MESILRDIAPTGTIITIIVIVLVRRWVSIPPLSSITVRFGSPEK